MRASAGARRLRILGLGALTACVAVTGASAAIGSASAVSIDGGVIQVFSVQPPAPPDGSGPTAACGDVSGYNVIRGDGRDELLLGTDGPDLIRGGGGDDLILGFGGNDCLVGGAGNDILFGQQQLDVLLGGEGNDIIFGGVGHKDQLDGGIGKDWCYGAPEDDVSNCEPWPFDDKMLRDFERLIDSLSRPHHEKSARLTPAKILLPPWLVEGRPWAAWLSEDGGDLFEVSLDAATESRVGLVQSSPERGPAKLSEDPESSDPSETTPDDTLPMVEHHGPESTTAPEGGADGTPPPEEVASSPEQTIPSESPGDGSCHEPATTTDECP